MRRAAPTEKALPPVRDCWIIEGTTNSVFLLLELELAPNWNFLFSQVLEMEAIHDERAQS